MEKKEIAAAVVVAKTTVAVAAEPKIKSSRFTLPPNVNGRCRGILSLCLREIQWSTVSPIQFNWIEAKFLWWGNKYHSAATVKLTCKKNQKKSIGHAIHYEILTKLTLFKKYLLGSENVIVKLASGISNIEIGEAVIVIPASLIEFIDKTKSKHSISPPSLSSFPIKSTVFDAQQKIIGEILMDFEMIVNDCVFNDMEMEMLPTQQNIIANADDDDKQQFNNGIENNMNQFNLDLNKFKSNKVHHKQKKSKGKCIDRGEKSIFRQERMPLSSTTMMTTTTTTTTQQISSKSRNISSPLLNYLTGRPLHAAEETEAVRAMASTSPTESLIDQLSYDLNGLYLPKKSSNTLTSDSIELNVLKKIDCMRIHIDDLCLTRAGIREILSKTNAPNEMSFGSGTFSVSVDCDSILTIAKSPFDLDNATFSSKVTRIFDTSIEAIPPAIEFNRSSVHKLNSFCIKSRSAYANGGISLQVSYRDIESSVAQTLGTVQFQLADLIQATNFTFQKQCPVTIASSEIICGRLSIKAELGCRGLHFGADFLEAISIDSINANHPQMRQFVNTTDNDEYCYNYNHLTQQHQCCLLQQNNNNIDRHDWCSNSLWFDDMNDLHAYDIHDEQTEDKSQTSSATPLNAATQNSAQINGNNATQKPGGGGGAQNDGKEHSLTLNQMDELSSDADENTLKGLFHVGHINYCSWYQSTTETFLVCRPFWITDTALVTENCPYKLNEENYQLNYLELFSVICDQKLIDATKHGFMSIEIWQRDTNHKIESLVGSAKVPLHQFYIAFNNNIIRNHVSKQELPVISIDGWITIAYAALPDSTPVGTVQAILAVGTTKQINNFKKSKSFLSCNSFIQFPLELYATQDIGAVEIPTSRSANKTDAQMSTKNGISDAMAAERHNNLTSMFSTFIDNLAARLPDRNLINSHSTETSSTMTTTTAATTTATATTTSDATTQTNAQINNSNNDTNNKVSTNAGNGKYMRPTSELLDDLQRALAIAPTAGQTRGYGLQPISIPEQRSTATSTTTNEPKLTNAVPPPKMFHVHIEIENALHLPTFAVAPHKKGTKRNRNTKNSEQHQNKSSGSGGGSATMEIEPNTYVTFEASATNAPSNSTTYITNIIETSCSPRWNKQFEVYLPADYLQNDERRFEIRVWRKVGDNTSKMRLIPNPSNDVTIGLASIDLSVLIAGLPFISGWFNIIDHSGCINGQLKIHIKPKDDLTIYQKRTEQKKNIEHNSSGRIDTVPQEVSHAATTNDMTIDQIPSAANVVATGAAVPVPDVNRPSAIDDSALSRALKRKFTELEEITQRLRARLFDVTGNMTIDPEDEFENDLNTIPDEGDDNFEESNMASEMSLDWLEHCHNQATAAAAVAAATAANETNTENGLSTAQMRDIFEYLSTTDSNQSQPLLMKDDEEQSIDSLLPDKLSSRFNEVINQEKIAWNKLSSASSVSSSIGNSVENSVDNIAETLQKSLIND